ncbi:MAG: hypothetical protein FJ026_09870, partial [Chloroflexi bacterium]|nr:hypothetical protein [Chloroflexota bacterium]
MYCNQCGIKLEENALICPNCGYRPGTILEPDEDSSATAEELAVATPVARASGCGWAMIAGMIAACALLLISALAFVGIYQGIQERNRLNRAAALEHYQKGVEQLAAENYELARAEFELALQLDPKNRDAANKLSEVNAALTSRPTPTSAVRYQTAALLYNEARELYNRGDWEGVIAKLEQVRALEPDYEREPVTVLLVEAYYKAALRLVGEDRMEEAIRYFDQALELRPGETAIREQKRLASLYLAGLGYWGANWQGAIDSLSVLYGLKPDYKDVRQRLYDAYVAYAESLASKGDWCAARDRYDNALAMTFSDSLKAE